MAVMALWPGLTALRLLRLLRRLQDSDFCYSPLGGNGGDTDRYVPAILFGCLPVLLNSAFGEPHPFRILQALPLEEVLRWEE